MTLEKKSYAKFQGCQNNSYKVPQTHHKNYIYIIGYNLQKEKEIAI